MENMACNQNISTLSVLGIDRGVTSVKLGIVHPW